MIINKDVQPVGLYLANVPTGKYFLRHFGGAAGAAKWQVCYGWPYRLGCMTYTNHDLNRPQSRLRPINILSFLLTQASSSSSSSNPRLYFSSIPECDFSRAKYVYGILYCENRIWRDNRTIPRNVSSTQICTETL